MQRLSVPVSPHYVPRDLDDVSDNDDDDCRLNVSFASSGKSWSEFDFREFYGSRPPSFPSPAAVQKPRTLSALTGESPPAVSAPTANSASKRRSSAGVVYGDALNNANHQVGSPSPGAHRRSSLGEGAIMGAPGSPTASSCTRTHSSPVSVARPLTISSPRALSLKSKLTIPSARTSGESPSLPSPPTHAASPPQHDSVGSPRLVSVGSVRSFAKSQSVARLSSVRSGQRDSAANSPKGQSESAPTASRTDFDDFLLDECAETDSAEDDIAMTSIRCWSDIKRAVRIDLPVVPFSGLGMTLAPLRTQQQQQQQQQQPKTTTAQKTEQAKGVYVAQVVSGGVADRNGVCVGDRILRVNGRSCDGLDPPAVISLIGDSVDAISVVLIKLLSSGTSADPSRILDAWINSGVKDYDTLRRGLSVGSPMSPASAPGHKPMPSDDSRSTRASTWDSEKSPRGTPRAPTAADRGEDSFGAGAALPLSVSSLSSSSGVDGRGGRAASDPTASRPQPQSAAITPDAEETGIWDEPLCAGVNIVFDAQGDVRGGTLNALVTYLTSEHDPEFLSVVLMTHRSFCSSEDLVKRLIQRFWGPPQGSPAASLPEVCDADACKNRRARVTNALKKLIDSESVDLPDKVVLVVRAFLKRLLEDGDMASQAPRQLIASLYRRTSVDRTGVDPSLASTSASVVAAASDGDAAQSSPLQSSGLQRVDTARAKSMSADKDKDNGTSDSSASALSPGMILLGKDSLGNAILVPRGVPPAAPDARALMSLSSKTIARQVTAVDHAMYRAIRPIELLDQSWSKADRRHNSANVLSFIRRFNILSRLVASSILSADKKPQGRGAAFEKWIKVAQHLHQLNSFNALTAVIAALGNSAVARLKVSKMWISRERTEALEKLCEFLAPSGSYRAYRNYLHSINPPCVPYLGVYLTDLTFIGDGNSNEISPGSINMTKRRMEHRVIYEVQQYQQSAYSDIAMDPVVIGMIEAYPLMADDGEMFKVSLEVEPRGADVGQAPSELQKKLAKKKGALDALIKGDKK